MWAGPRGATHLCHSHRALRAVCGDAAAAQRSSPGLVAASGALSAEAWAGGLDVGLVRRDDADEAAFSRRPDRGAVHHVLLSLTGLLHVPQALLLLLLLLQQLPLMFHKLQKVQTFNEERTSLSLLPKRDLALQHVLQLGEALAELAPLSFLFEQISSSVCEP